MVEKVNSVVVQLGMTPRYLDPRCHEALYEVDAGVNEVHDRWTERSPEKQGLGFAGCR